MALDFFFNATSTQLRSALTLSLGTASAARAIRTAADANTSSRGQRQQKLDQGRLDAQAREATRKVEGFTKLKSRQLRAVNIIDKANERLQEMKALLLEARELIVKADNPDIDASARRGHATKFDQLLGQLNIKMKGANFAGVNMIGSSIRDVHEGQDVEVEIRPGSLATRRFEGRFLGSDYEITSLTGDAYLPDLFGKSLQRSPPVEGDDGLLVKDTDTIVYDEGTGAISFTRDGEATPYLEGTLERKGIGVAHTFLYNGLQTEAGRDRALQDVEDGLSSLRFHIAVFEGYQTQAQVAVDFSERQVAENRTAASRIRADKSTAEQRFNLEEQRRALLFQSALQSSLSFNAGGQQTLLGAIPGLFDFEV